MKYDVNQLKASKDVKGLAKAWWGSSYQEEIADAMAEIGSDEAVAELLNIFRVVPANESVVTVMKALVKIGDVKVVKPIIECLKHHGGFGSSINDVGVNTNLAWILTNIGETVTEPLINVLLEDGDLRVQRWIIEILGYIGDSRAARPIIEHAISNERNRQNAKWYLRWTYANTNDHIKALALIGEPAVAPLRESLNYENRKVQEFVKKALREIE